MILGWLLPLQAQLFDHPEYMQIVSKGTEFIYNAQPDSAERYIVLIEKRLPNHPVSSMMRALSILWANLPVVTLDDVFEDLNANLRETIRRAALLDGGRQEHPEAIFFEMSARGLLAEYFADDGHYMKAFSEASKAYDLIKQGFELSENQPEFLLTTGVYNYFREKYPERYPVYKPLIWFFKSGDVELGLEQMKQAMERATLTKAEAAIYLGYVYLRYDFQPEKAQFYLKSLTDQYPNNPYVKAKYLEALAAGDDFRLAKTTMIDDLLKIKRPYYQMAGLSFYGFYFEKEKHDLAKAKSFYLKAIAAGESIAGHGEYYRYLACLGIGRLALKSGNLEEAKKYLEMVTENSEAEDLVSQAELLLEKL